MLKSLKFNFGSLVLIGAILGLNSSAVFAVNVSLKNGNLFTGYTDIIYPGGFEPKIERVYNSKSPYQGKLFGWGWGTEYEAYLSVSADGSVVVHEYGGGADNRFSPNSFNQTELDSAVDKIALVAQKAGMLGSASQMNTYKQKLKADANFRNEEWEKFREQGKIEARKLKDGTQLHSNRFNYQFITKVQNGYFRSFDTGKIEKFDDAGKLVKISDKNGNSIELSYTKDGKLQKLVDNFNRKIFFEYNTQGLLSKLEGVNGKKAEYQYNSKNELVLSRDVDGNTYSYKYDDQSRHNLIEVGYSDKSNVVISYYGRDKLENVKSIKERDGTLTEYDYKTDSSDHGHTSISVNVKGPDGKEISNSKYEYFVKNKRDGEEWTQKLITVLDGDRTETTYNEDFGLPTQINHGGEETRFEYDQKGHVTKKITPDEVTELHYDLKAGKVDKVTKTARAGSKTSRWSHFKYDERANLIYAENSDKQQVWLYYDSNGRIQTLKDKNQRQISFKYNENSKPVEIKAQSLGTITVTYANSGEIKKVDSTAGRKVALQVTSAFQGLLDIIRPAGVTLSF